MRLNLTPALETRDGTANKNARLTNALKEGPRVIARPGMDLTNTYAGAGQGLIVFDGRLLGAYNNVITDVAAGVELNFGAIAYAAGTTYAQGDAVWFNGVLYTSTAAGNTGHTPSSTSTWWTMGGWVDPAWDENLNYEIGETATFGGFTYYSLIQTNLGKSPATNPTYWSLTPPTSTRWIGTTASGTYSATYSNDPSSCCAELFQILWGSQPSVCDNANWIGPTPLSWITYDGAVFTDANRYDIWTTVSYSGGTYPDFCSIQNLGTSSKPNAWAAKVIA